MSRHAARQYPDLRTYLAESGDTQVAVATAVHTSQAHISRIVAGDVIPRPLLAARLVRHCHIPLDSFTRVFLVKHGRRTKRPARERVAS